MLLIYVNGVIISQNMWKPTITGSSLAVVKVIRCQIEKDPVDQN